MIFYQTSSLGWTICLLLNNQMSQTHNRTEEVHVEEATRIQTPKPISDHTENSSRQHTKTLPHSSNEVRMNRGAMGVTRQKTERGKKAQLVHQGTFSEQQVVMNVRGEQVRVRMSCMWPSAQTVISTAMVNMCGAKGQGRKFTQRGLYGKNIYNIAIHLKNALMHWYRY